MKRLILSLLFFCFANELIAQDFKTLASKEIDNENFAKAIRYLEQAVASNPNDAEAWYLLGHSLHWLSYDSALLPGFDKRVSDRILDCMQKALTLDPRLRNCYSVIGSERGARAEEELQSGNRARFINELRLGRSAGAYPDWLLEYARNTLNSCDSNSILFANGDANVFPAWYCQNVEGVRTDVTLCPVALLESPWFVLALKFGVDSVIQPVAMPWTREQIMDLHLSKWTNQNIELPIPRGAQRRYGTPDSVFQWFLTSDVKRDDRSMLSVNRIVMLGLIRANNWVRPVHFSLGFQAWTLADLKEHLRINAMTVELVPFSVKQDLAFKVNIAPTVRFLTNADNFRRLITLKDEDIPYISPPMNNYRLPYLLACDSLLSTGDFKTAKIVFEAMGKNVPESVLPIPEGWKPRFDELRRRIKVVGQ